MGKRITLLALASVSATLFALPAASSANPAVHISNATTFTLSSNVKSFRTRADNNNVECTSTSSSGGQFTSTTTFKVILIFKGCKSLALGVTCQSGATAGEIVTTQLEGHLITVTTPAQTGTIHGLPGILFTGNAGHVASYNCFGIAVTWKGAGFIGEIATPTCGANSTTMGLKFTSASPGNQKHIAFTGINYDLTSTIGGSAATMSIDAEATIAFPESQKLECT